MTDWTKHDRECLMEWEHNWFADMRLDGRCKPVYTKTSDVEIPPTVVILLHQIIKEGARYINVNCHTCPEHGQWVAMIFGVPMGGQNERTMLVSLDIKSASDRETLWKAFKDACIEEASQIAAEQIGKLTKNFPPEIVKMAGGEKSMANWTERMRQRAVRQAKSTVAVCKSCMKVQVKNYGDQCSSCRE